MKFWGKIFGTMLAFYFVTFCVGPMIGLDRIFPGDLVGELVAVRKYLMPVYWGLVCLCGFFVFCVIYILEVVREETKKIETLLHELKDPATKEPSEPTEQPPEHTNTDEADCGH